ncbi:MAG: hypothetical protein ABI904_23565 [Chloroflexota bacterium]
MTQPSLGFVIVFLIFSLLFFSNTYKLWFKTDEYYQSIYNSLTAQPSLYPFKDFFLKRLENKRNWILWQKVFSLLGILAVLGADVLVVLGFVFSK